MSSSLVVFHKTSDILTTIFDGGTNCVNTHSAQRGPNNGFKQYIFLY